MQINYWRIAIYVLTFLTYAYSGYGSNIIHNLRDAIIAAEAVFGDVFKNFIHVARKFHTVHQVFDAAVEENCIFKCPGGKLHYFIVIFGSMLLLLGLGLRTGPDQCGPESLSNILNTNLFKEVGL